MRREADQVRLPEGNRFTPEGTAGKPFHDRISGRICIGLLCSSIVFIAFNFGGVKTVLRWVFTAGHSAMGDPAIIEEAKKQAKDTLKELKEAAKQNQTLPVAVPTIPQLNPIKAAGNAINTKVDEVKDDIKGAIGALSPAAQRAMDAFHEKQERDRAARDALLRVEAHTLGIECDESTPIEEVAAKVHAVKSASAKAKHDAFIGWWDANGPNGYCPKKHPIRVSRAGNAVHICPRCGARARASAIRAAGDPPKPKQYPDEFELWWSRQ